jgi:hypothetical protein
MAAGFSGLNFFRLILTTKVKTQSVWTSFDLKRTTGVVQNQEVRAASFELKSGCFYESASIQIVRDGAAAPPGAL